MTPFDRTAYGHWTTVPTRWNDNDVYGHVNNTVHYAAMDTVINAWMIEQGVLDVEHHANLLPWVQRSTGARRAARGAGTATASISAILHAITHTTSEPDTRQHTHHNNSRHPRPVRV